MTKKFLSLDETSGLLTYAVNEDGKNHVGYYQDVEGQMDYAAGLRQATNRCEQGRKENFWHVAHVPASIIMKMWVEDKVNFYDKEQWPQVLKLIETKYPRFKTTEKRIA